MSQQYSTERMDRTTFEQTAPDATSALISLGQTVDRAGLEKSLTELVKLRASQINACTFCIGMHQKLSLQHGASEAQVAELATWRTTTHFSARERAALAWAEALTLMAKEHPSDSVYAEVKAQFSPKEIAYLTASIANINAWNRIAGGLGFTYPK